MIELKVKFDSIGEYKDAEGNMQKAKSAHFIVGKPGDKVSGGLYLPVKMKFPSDGIIIKLSGD